MKNEQAENDLPFPSDLIPTNKAAKLAGGCAVSTVYRWILTGYLRGWRRRGRWFVSRADVLAMFKELPTLPERPAVPVEFRAKLKTPQHVLDKLKAMGAL